MIQQRVKFGVDKSAMARWSLPLLLELCREWKRFGALGQALAPVSPRALSLALNQLQQADLIEQKASLYGLTDRGRDFASPLLRAV